MTPVAVIAGAQVRRGWRPLAVLAVFVAVASGLAMAGIAGARRTASVLDRAVEITEASDVLVNPDAGSESALTVEAIEALPMVADASRLDAVAVVPEGGVRSQREFEDQPNLMVSDGGALHRFARPVVAAGRLPDAAEPGELFVDRNYADAAHLEVGDELRYRIIGLDDLERLFTPLSDEELAALTAEPDFGTPVALTVVGIGTTPDALVVDEGFEPLPMFATPALADAVGPRFAPYWGAVVRLTDQARLEEFRSAVDDLVPDEQVVYQTLEATRPRVERAISPGAVTLLVFGVTAAGLGLLLIAQAISRRLQLDARDADVLASLGTTRRERFAASMVTIAAVAATGASAGGVVAWLLSPASPVGPARRLEPQRGFRLDIAVVGLGAALTVVGVLAVAAPIAWRWARLGAAGTGPGRSVLGGWLASAGAPVPLTTGVRFGLESGRGATAVPTRATLIGATTGVVLAVATLVFAGSIDTVVSTPRLYGADWTAAIDFLQEDDEAPYQEDAAEIRRIIAHDPAVEASTIVGVSEVRLDGGRTPALSFLPGGNITPTITAGRAPGRIDEIALGATTMRRHGLRIGDRVTLTAPGYDGEATVVGRAVLPGAGVYQAADKTALGEGVVVEAGALGDLDQYAKLVFATRLAGGADRAAFEERISTSLRRWGMVYFQEIGRPADVQSLERIRRLPLVLCAVLVGLIAATVVHALGTAVRRRRRDLAVLNVLGASRRALRSIALFQALTVAALAVVVGLPLGVVVGRVAWSAIAEAYGTAAEPVVPVVSLGLVATTVVAVAAFAGLVPATRGMRRRLAEALRAE